MAKKKYEVGEILIHKHCCLLMQVLDYLECNNEPCVKVKQFNIINGEKITIFYVCILKEYEIYTNEIGVKRLNDAIKQWYYCNDLKQHKNYDYINLIIDYKDFINKYHLAKKDFLQDKTYTPKTYTPLTIFDFME